MKQIELFEIPADKRYEDLRACVRFELGMHTPLGLKQVLKLAEKFQIIEGRVLAVIEEERKKLPRLIDYAITDINDEEYDEEYEEDED